MPTPSGDILLEPTFLGRHERPSHSICPPEIEMRDGWGGSNGDLDRQENQGSESSNSQMELALDVCPSVLLEHELNNNLEHELRTKVDERIPHHEPRSTAMAGEGHTGEIDPEGAVMNGSAASPDEDENPFCSDTGASRRKPGPNKTVKSQDAGNRNAQDRGHRLRFALTRSLDKNAPSSSSQNWMTSSIRLRSNYTSSFLHTGSKFQGTQQSDQQIYKVEVEIKHVDMAESFLCGYLRIEGLTDEHHVLTTYFEGELIGSKYTFQTKHEDWCANEKTDHHHWSRFPAYRPIQSQAKKPDFHYKNWAQREHIFMRWKEYFLVPDHRVREITGASFEGFYYICFNQVAGSVSGIYFHAKSEKYQQLELQHVPDKGCVPCVEFR